MANIRLPLALAGSGTAIFAYRRSGQPAGITAGLSWTNTLVSAFAFPLLNPIVEEQQHRGYVQPRLAAAAGSIQKGIVITAAGFGLQKEVR